MTHGEVAACPGSCACSLRPSQWISPRSMRRSGPGAGRGVCSRWPVYLRSLAPAALWDNAATLRHEASEDEEGGGGGDDDNGGGDGDKGKGEDDGEGEGEGEGHDGHRSGRGVCAHQCRMCPSSPLFILMLHVACPLLPQLCTHTTSPPSSGRGVSRSSNACTAGSGWVFPVLQGGRPIFQMCAALTTGSPTHTLAYASPRRP